jgi:adenosylhomocysteine nucleosidase
MYGIIGAMRSEVEELVSLLDGKEEIRIGALTFYRGKLLGAVDAVIAECGVGKVNAAITATLMIREFSPRAIINTGVSGALSPALSVGDLVIGDSFVQHDMDTSPIGDPVGFVTGPNLVYFPADEALVSAAVAAAASLGLPAISGRVASGDQFIAGGESKARIRTCFDAATCEMEGAAIAHACYLLGTPVAVIRSISDLANGESPVDFPTFVALAAKNSSRLVQKLLLSLSEADA